MLSANIVEAANVIVNEGFIERRANNNAFIKFLSFMILPWKQLFLKYMFIKVETVNEIRIVQQISLKTLKELNTF